ncbi:quinone-dependent dihydroorotate dehydrogenase [bacterium]|nr:quinone-dependent dihydroorotate dehydrogenase [bacterium]
MLNLLYPAARAVLFRIDAERAHHFSMAGLRASDKLGLLGAMTSKPESKPVTFARLTFPNPVGLAAGLDKEANTIDALGTMGFGHVEVGTLTPKPQDGNEAPRLFRLPEHQALINRMGFNNPGIDQGLANARGSTSFKGIIGINIGKNKVTPNEQANDDYAIAFEKSYPWADYITANFSSPNTPGLRDLQSEDAAGRLLEVLKNLQTKLHHETGRYVPFALKVAPDLDESQISGLSRVFRDGGLDFLIATNTTIARDAVKGHPNAEEVGGLSGAPLTQHSTEVIASFHAGLGDAVPIIGAGGIFTAEDALAKRDAGAKLVQLYTGFVYKGPQLIHDIIKAW